MTDKIPATTPQKLTPDDPVSPEILLDFQKLENARIQIAGRLLDIEQDRVKLLAAAHRIDEQRQRTFERILLERGLPPNTEFEVDSTNGKIKVLRKPEASHTPAVAKSA